MHLFVRANPLRHVFSLRNSSDIFATGFFNLACKWMDLNGCMHAQPCKLHMCTQYWLWMFHRSGRHCNCNMKVGHLPNERAPCGLLCDGRCSSTHKDTLHSQTPDEQNRPLFFQFFSPYFRPPFLFPIVHNYSTTKIKAQRQFYTKTDPVALSSAQTIWQLNYVGIYIAIIYQLFQHRFQISSQVRVEIW